jgi:S-adenosylmethionine synthetase
MISNMEYSLLTSESVTEGHPDKVCDQISDGVLDEIVRQDPTARVACEAFISVGFVIVGGEITTSAHIDVPSIARGILKEIGYTSEIYGFNYKTCGVLNAIGKQSPDIAQGVDVGGAGDQGMMIGYACRETEELMPLPIMQCHRMCQKLAELRKNKTLSYLGPDGKSQATVEYKMGVPQRVDSVIVSSQHTDEILDSTGERITQDAIDEIIDKVVRDVIDPELLDKDTKYYVNPTGKFVVGGPQSDTGMTGRKIVVDTYGGLVPHGGGAFSGKDSTKVDRSAAYAARYVAKNVVASGVADRCAVSLAYAIGVPEPTAVMVNTFGTGKMKDRDIVGLVGKHFDLTPKSIIETLDLRRPIFRKTAAYGHFGRDDPDFTWERTDVAEDIAKSAGI